MRGLFITVLLLSLLPVVFFKPHIGILVWSWVSHMNPHAITYGFAHSFPFLDLTAACTFFGLLLARENRSPPNHPVLWFMAAYYVWTAVTTLLGFNPNMALGDFISVSKMILFAALTAIIMQSPRRLDWYVMVMVASMAFITVSGAVFVLVTGGSARVQGAGGMIDDNNKLAMAIAMTMPLMFYYFYHPPFRWVKWPALLGGFSFIIAGLGTQSRGGLVAMACAAFFVAALSRNRIRIFGASAVLLLIGLQFVPDSWTARFSTTSEAQTDESFISRVVMWKFAHALSMERPVYGGGYDVFFEGDAKRLYMPPGHRAFEAHNVYFEVLATHGYVGLMLFTGMIFTAFFICGSQAKRFEPYGETRHLSTLCRMLQACIVAYCVGGLTIHLAQYDLLYNLMAIVILVGVIGDKLIQQGVTPYVPNAEIARFEVARPKFHPTRP